MAYRKMTFTIPEPLARRFVRSVPTRHRSEYVAQALDALLSDRERRLVEACDVANADPDVLALEREFDAVAVEMTEPWTPDASTRRRPSR